MSKILKHKVSNRNHNFLYGKMEVKGQLQVLVDEYPEFIYKQYDNYYYAETNGFVSIYEHKPGTYSGFAGRTFTLKMEDGTEQSFTGSLWDPYDVKHPDVPKYKPISVTNEEQVFERGFTYYAYYCTPELYYKTLSNDIAYNNENCSPLECPYYVMDYPGETNCSLFDKYIVDDKKRCKECLELIKE